MTETTEKKDEEKAVDPPEPKLEQPDEKPSLPPEAELVMKSMLAAFVELVDEVFRRIDERDKKLAALHVEQAATDFRDKAELVDEVFRRIDERDKKLAALHVEQAATDFRDKAELATLPIIMARSTPDSKLSVLARLAAAQADVHAEQRAARLAPKPEAKKETVAEALEAGKAL